MEGINKATRLATWNYSEEGCYHVVFCTHERAHILGEVLHERAADGSALVAHTNGGRACCGIIEQIPDLYPNASVDVYVVMPNHVHMLCAIQTTEGEGQRSLLARIVGFVKSHTTMAMRKTGFTGDVWQRGYYDHIVRDERDYLRIYEYIQNNPAKWAEDRFYE